MVAEKEKQGAVQGSLLVVCVCVWKVKNDVKESTVTPLACVCVASSPRRARFPIGAEWSRRRPPESGRTRPAPKTAAPAGAETSLKTTKKNTNHAAAYTQRPGVNLCKRSLESTAHAVKREGQVARERERDKQSL